ncbi:MAG: hypothetical protein GY801_02730 [bacterium]|nr:hypothetical protein [bacterium]
MNAKGADEQRVATLLKSVMGNKKERMSPNGGDTKPVGHEIAMDIAEDNTDERDTEFERF